MSPNTPKHTHAWVSFTYASFILAAGMLAFAIYYLPIDIWMRGYFAMGTVMLVQSTATLTKTLRDREESERLMNRIEDAKAERLLMEVGKD